MNADANADNSILQDERLRLYQEMVRIRRFEEHIASVYMSDILKTPVHLSLGQEAVAVGVCGQMAADEILFSNYRNHAHYLAKGGDLQAIANELNNRATGCSGGRGGSMHVCDMDVNILGTTAIVGGAVPLAVGAALSSKLKGENTITVVFFGDGAAEEGGTYESLNFALAHDLPILFVCENNAYAIYASLAERTTSPKIIDRFNGLGIQSWEGDGNDLDEVRGLAATALDYVRQGKPALLEVHTMLMAEHVGTFTKAKSDVLGNEWQTWEGDCPLVTFRKRLSDEGLGEDQLSLAEADANAEIANAFETALNEPLPDPATLMNNVYR